LSWILLNSYVKLSRCWLLLWLMLLSGTVELRFMFRLLFTIIHLWSWSIWCLVSSLFSSWGHGRSQDVSSGIMLIIFSGLIFICCGAISLVVSCERRLHDTSPSMGLVRCIVYLDTNCGLLEWQKPKPPLENHCTRERRILEFKAVVIFILITFL
jgi:hypothetical protein